MSPLPWEATVTPKPLSPCAITSHAATPTAVCLDTAYPAAPICVSSPAAEAIDMKLPPPRVVHSGRSASAASVHVRKVPSGTWTQSVSLASPGAPMMPAFGDEDVDGIER